MPHWLFVSCLLFSKSHRPAQPNNRSITTNNQEELKSSKRGTDNHLQHAQRTPGQKRQYSGPNHHLATSFFKPLGLILQYDVNAPNFKKPTRDRCTEQHTVSGSRRGASRLSQWHRERQAPRRNRHWNGTGRASPWASAIDRFFFEAPTPTAANRRQSGA